MGRIRLRRDNPKPERFERSRWHTVSKKLMKFYNSKAWRQTREHYLSEHPFCEMCEEKNMLSPGHYVDHIQPALERPDLRLSWNNLQTLCISCNAKKTSGQANKKKK
jgi:5-methylcytosine-specific restriction protein A